MPWRYQTECAQTSPQNRSFVDVRAPAAVPTDPTQKENRYEQKALDVICCFDRHEFGLPRLGYADARGEPDFRNDLDQFSATRLGRHCSGRNEQRRSDLRGRGELRYLHLGGGRKPGGLGG